MTQRHDYIPPNLIYYTCLELDARGIQLENNGFWGPVAEPLRNCDHPRVSYHASRKLLTEAVRISGDPDLGLSVGLRQSITTLGVMLGAVMACDTYKDVVALSVRYHPLAGGMNQIAMAEEPNGDVYVYVSSPPDDPVLKRFLVQEMAAVTQLQAKFIYPPGDGLKSMEFSFRDGDPVKMADQLGCHVALGSDVDRVVFRGDVMNMRLPTADPFSLQNSIQVLDSLLEAEMDRESLLHQVEVLCQRRLQDGISLAEVARELSMSERSLRRKLEAVGARFQQILDRVRRDRASEMLLETDLSVEEIAKKLGFADARSLRRILVSRTGKTPGQIRRDARIAAASKLRR